MNTIIKNKLFLSVLIAGYAQAMNHQQKLTVYANTIAISINTVDQKIVEENRNKCLALGLQWTDNTKDLIEIKPRHYIDNTPFINCLIQNPRILNQAISQCTEKSKEERIRLMMTPQFPKYIPLDALQTMDTEHHYQWHLYNCTFDICLIFTNNLEGLLSLQTPSITNNPKNTIDDRAISHSTTDQQIKYFTYITASAALCYLYYMLL